MFADDAVKQEQCWLNWMQSAYRIVPVNPADRQLLSMSLNGQAYIDTVLPFGLRCSYNFHSLS